MINNKRLPFIIDTGSRIIMLEDEIYIGANKEPVGSIDVKASDNTSAHIQFFLNSKEIASFIKGLYALYLKVKDSEKRD